MNFKGLRRVGEATQDPAITFLLLLPLGLIHLSAGRLSQSGAFSLVQGALEWAGPGAWPMLGLWLGLGFLWALGRIRAQSIPWGAGALLAVIEGLLWGLLLGPLLSWLSHSLPLLFLGNLQELSFTVHSRLALAAGAGLYEEIIFRALLLGGGFVVLRLFFRLLGLRSVALPLALVVALLGSSSLFAWAHGAGDPNALIPAVFVWRLLAGLVLGVLFCFRGLAVTAWAHAAYDALLIPE